MAESGQSESFQQKEPSETVRHDMWWWPVSSFRAGLLGSTSNNSSTGMYHELKCAVCEKEAGRGLAVRRCVSTTRPLFCSATREPRIFRYRFTSIVECSMNAAIFASSLIIRFGFKVLSAMLWLES